MYRFTTYIALFLLLLFARVMVPDQLLLPLHSHAHTEHSHLGDQKKAHIEKKHTHCPVEDLFGAPFHGAMEAFAFTEPSVLPEHVVRHTDAGTTSCYTFTQQRGPPAVA